MPCNVKHSTVWGSLHSRVVSTDLEGGNNKILECGTSNREGISTDFKAGYNKILWEGGRFSTEQKREVLISEEGTIEL